MAAVGEIVEELVVDLEKGKLHDDGTFLLPWFVMY